MISPETADLFGFPLRFIFTGVRAAFKRPKISFKQLGSPQAENAMSILVDSSSEIPWWKEPCVYRKP
jgi:hypothetical protein